MGDGNVCKDTLTPCFRLALDERRLFSLPIFFLPIDLISTDFPPDSDYISQEKKINILHVY